MFTAACHYAGPNASRFSSLRGGKSVVRLHCTDKDVSRCQLARVAFILEAFFVVRLHRTDQDVSRCQLARVAFVPEALFVVRLHCTD